MAVRTYYKHTRVEDVNVPYNFQCENCMKNSGDLQAHLVGSEATYNSNFKTISDERDQALKKQAHKNLVKKVKEAYKDAENEIYCTEFRDECPHCHKVQSWGVSGLKKQRFDTPKAILILGLLVTGVALLGHYFSTSQDVPLSIAYGALGITVAGTILSFLWNVIKISRKRRSARANGARNKPNISWNKVQDLLSEEK